MNEIIIIILIIIIIIIPHFEQQQQQQLGEDLGMLMGSTMMKIILLMKVCWLESNLSYYDFYYRWKLRNYYITIFMEIRVGVGCRMGGLRQTCARTIHGYYYYWVEIPFFYVLFKLLLYEATREAYEYNNDVRYVWNEQQQRPCNIVISCSF